jgi:hypothetical protein
VVSGRNRAIGRLSGGAAIGALLSAFAGVTLVGTGSAWAACTLSAGVYTCSAVDATAPVVLSGNPLSVILDGTFVNPTAQGPASVNLNATTGAGALTVNQAAGSSVLGSTDGIYAANNGAGAMTITTAGSISGGAIPVPGFNNAGVDAYNGPTATGLTINQTAGTISGVNEDIWAYNAGTGATTITTAGTVTGGTNADGVTVANVGTASALTVNQTAGSISGFDGIDAENYGTGAMTITTAGTVTGTG